MKPEDADAEPSASSSRRPRPARMYVLLAILVLLSFVLFGGPLRALLRKRAVVHVTSLGPGVRGPLPAVQPAEASVVHPGPYEPKFTEPSVQTLQVGSVARRYVQIDSKYESGKPELALVLVLHGDGGSAESFHQAFPYERTTTEYAVVVYPDGLGNTWTLGGADPNPDLAFIDALVAKVIAGGQVDPHKVFAVGYSSGGFLANLIACRRPGLLRAFASNAGGAPYEQKLSYPNGFPKCEGEQPTAALLLHGDRDLGVTVDSGEFSAEYWSYVNGCDVHERETTDYGECQAYRGCPKATPVVWCEIPDLGHWVWSRGAEASWQFFKTLTTAD